MFVMPGVGPRPACHIPDPRDSWQQRTLWFSHVIVSRAANPALQWYLKIWLESEIALRHLIFASLEPQECIFTILHSSISKIGMFRLSLWHGWAKLACANSASGHVCSNVQCTYMPQAQVMPCGSTGPVPETPRKKLFPKSRKKRYMEFILSKKFWN